MNNRIKYEIDENNHLILKSVFNGLEIGTVDGGDIEEILHKVKMYDEEYNNLINQNRLMIEIQKDYKEKDKEIKRLNNIIDEIRKIVKYEKEELDKFKGVDLLINTYQQVFGVMLEMLELKEGK